MNTLQERFCREYIIDDSATRAAIRSGYSEATAGQQGYQLLQRGDVKVLVGELRAERDKRLEITADKILEQYRRLAFSDINDYYCFKYQLQFFTGTTTKEKRKRERLIKYIGNVITEEQYIALPKCYKYYYNPYKVLKELDDLTVEQRAAIQSITYDKHGNRILKLSNKETSLDALSKHMQLFTDKVDINHSGGTTQRIINVNPTKGK